MESVNFLPQSYRQHERQRARRIRQMTVGGVLLIALAGWWLVQRAYTGELHQRLTAVREQARLAQRQARAASRLETRQAALRHRVALQRRLTPPLEYRQVVATIGRLMPPTVALRELRLQTDRPGEADRPAADQSAEDAGPGTLRIELVGMAPHDMAVANLMTALEEHGLFTRVSMRYSRPQEIAGQSGRQFALELEVALDRRFEPPATGTKGVAHAG